MGSSWAGALIACAQEVHQRLLPVLDACAGLEGIPHAQIAMQLRNAAAHVDWSLAQEDADQVRRAHDHVRRAILDGCKLLWEGHSAGRGLAGADALAAQTAYANLSLSPFQGFGPSSQDAVERWFAFLKHQGVSIPSLPAVEVSSLDAASLRPQVTSWHPVRRADADLLAATLRLPDDLPPLYLGLWRRFAGALLVLPPTVHHDTIQRLSGSAGPVPLPEAMTVAVQVLGRLRDGWRLAVLGCALDDPQTFPNQQRARLLADLRLRQVEVAWTRLSALAPGYALAVREQALARAEGYPTAVRPVGPPVLPVEADGLVWFCDLVDSTGAGGGEAVLQAFLALTAEALLPARRAGTLMAANTWGDAAMAAFVRVDDGLDALARLVKALRGQILPLGAGARIGVATGRLRRLPNPITLYDVTGEAVVTAARLEPCARAVAGTVETLGTSAVAPHLAAFPGWTSVEVERIVAKKMRWEGHDLAAATPFTALRLEFA